MNNAILKVSSTAELTVLKVSAETNMQTVGVVYSLNTNSILTDCYSKLVNLDIDEFHVVLQGNIVLSKNNNATTLKELSCMGINKYSVVSNSDIDRLIYLGNQLGVNKLYVYDLLDVYELMGKSQPVILCGDYLNNEFSYVYVTSRGIEEFRIWRSADIKQLKALSSDVNCKLCLSVFNNILNDDIAKEVSNWIYIDNKTRNLLSLGVGSLLISPILSYDNINGELVLNSKEIEKAPVEPKKINKKLNSIIPAKATDKPKEQKNKHGKHTAHRFDLNKCLSAVGIVLSVALGFNVVANKQLPKDLDYLGGKKLELVELVNPKQSTLDYFSKYSKSLAADGTNIDANYITQISSLEVNGILAEIKLQKDSVGLVVYLRNAADIDAYVAKLGEVIKVSQVANKGTVSLDNTTLTKFIINGIR